MVVVVVCFVVGLLGCVLWWVFLCGVVGVVSEAKWSLELVSGTCLWNWSLELIGLLTLVGNHLAIRPLSQAPTNSGHLGS